MFLLISSSAVWVRARTLNHEIASSTITAWRMETNSCGEGLTDPETKNTVLYEVVDVFAKKG
jgi:hypothetical protein